MSQPTTPEKKSEWLKVANLVHFSKEKLPKSLNVYRVDSESLVIGIEEKKADGQWTKDFFKLSEPEASYLMVRLQRELMK